MKIRGILIVLLVVIASSSYAQVGSMLKNRLNKAINKEVQNKVDSAADNKNQQNETQGEGRSKGLGAMLGGKTDIKHADEYEFTGRIFMIMETFDKKESSRTNFFTYFNTGTLNAGIEVKPEDQGKNEQAVPARFVFDNDNRCFLVLMENDGSKTGIISTIPDDSTMASQAKNQQETEGKKAIVTKTGNTRIVAGYKCEEYKVVEPEEDGYANVWMTKDVMIKADRRNWNKTGMPSYYGYPEFEGSMMLAMESYDKNSKMTMKMETQEINENYKHSISTVGYPLIKVNFGQAGRK